MPRSRFPKSEAVIDTSCLLCLLILDRKFPQYTLLRALFLRYAAVHIPQHVWNELRRRGRARGRLQGLLRDYPLFKRCDVGSPYEAQLLYDKHTNPHARIDRGEAEAIVQARERGLSDVLIDERKGTRIARAHSLNPRGIAGLIREFKLNGMISAAQPLFAEIRQEGFWLSDKVVNEILEELGEIS
jgi:predicted nucleic acid-binding protein